MLLAKVQTTAPGVSQEALISTGATELRQVFPPDQLKGVLEAYMSGLQLTFAIVLGAVILAFMMSTYIPWWRRLGQMQGAPKQPEDATGKPDA